MSGEGEAGGAREAQSKPRVALVTGAARGIGAATVRALTAEGWSVLAVDRCADDPALPYHLATQADPDAVVARAAGSPGEVHGPLAWLAGDGSSGMTGAVVPVDGGLAL